MNKQLGLASSLAILLAVSLVFWVGYWLTGWYAFYLPAAIFLVMSIGLLLTSLPVLAAIFGYRMSKKLKDDDERNNNNSGGN